MALFDLNNHVAIVTGANHGIGAATARVLTDCGLHHFLDSIAVIAAALPGQTDILFDERRGERPTSFRYDGCR